MTVVTRFAPSPTGFLHIGGARTALFNWLYARGRGGKMLLRIEDTDRERSTQAAIDAILDGLSWLGIAWDGDTIYQFARQARHREVAEALLASGNAYYCYASPEELTQMREAARADGRAKLYDGRWRDRDAADAPAGVKPTIRLKAPLTGETVIEDQVQGRVVWQNENLDDLVLLRSDGTPTYMLAVVVDDHDMGVTHVIRGDDHLTNAARQKQIYDALGWTVPVMAHIPLIHGPDGSKLSKRHGALGVDAYRAMGYLPAALRNYLVRLGWAHGDQEIFSTEEMIAAFDLPQIGRSPARFDFAKLESLNGHYIRQSDDAELLAAIERAVAAYRRRRGACRQADAGLAAAVSGGHAELKGTCQDACSISLTARIFFSPTGRSRWTTRRPPTHPGGARLGQRRRRRTRQSGALDGGSDRTGRPRLRRAAGRQARRRGAAVTRSAHRPHHLARDFRSAHACSARKKVWRGLADQAARQERSRRAVGRRVKPLCRLMSFAQILPCRALPPLSQAIILQFFMHTALRYANNAG